MIILAFDTATRATSVALCGGTRELLEIRDDPPDRQRPRHATRLMPLIEEVLDRGGVGWADVERIAVGTGPGTFTGLRIGIATARGLALASGVPLVGVSTLRSLAEGAAEQAITVGARSVTAVLDARRGEAFAASWPIAGVGLDETPSLAPAACAPEGLAERLDALPGPTLAVGEGAVEFRLVIERAGVVVPESDCSLHKVSAIHHCRVAADQPASALDEVQPEYLRLPDAEIARRSAADR